MTEIELVDDREEAALQEERDFRRLVMEAILAGQRTAESFFLGEIANSRLLAGTRWDIAEMFSKPTIKASEKEIADLRESAFKEFALVMNLEAAQMVAGTLIADMVSEVRKGDRDLSKAIALAKGFQERREIPTPWGEE